MQILFLLIMILSTVGFSLSAEKPEQNIPNRSFIVGGTAEGLNRTASFPQGGVPIQSHIKTYTVHKVGNKLFDNDGNDVTPVTKVYEEEVNSSSVIMIRPSDYPNCVGKTICHRYIEIKL